MCFMVNLEIDNAPSITSGSDGGNLSLHEQYTFWLY